MIVIIGLLVLIAAVVVAVLGVANNSGGAHSLGDGFALFGHHLNGLSTGQLFLGGIVVGVVAMLGLSLHVSIPACVHEVGVWASAGAASIAISASPAKVKWCFNINVSPKWRPKALFMRLKQAASNRISQFISS